MINKKAIPLLPHRKARQSYWSLVVLDENDSGSGPRLGGAKLIASGTCVGLVR